MAGRLIAIVGPSGVGKDSVIDALARHRADLTIVRRTITREPGLGGEAYEPVTEAEFARRVADGAFCLHWRAHGLAYGIPNNVRDRVAAGQDMVVNLSRGILTEAQAKFPGFAVVHLTARPETLLNRLQERSRETLDDITRRLARSKLRLPDGIAAFEISNDGSLAETAEAALCALYPARV